MSVNVHKSKKKPVDKGTTIDIAPMEIHCTYEEDFESLPEWRISVAGGVGYWPKSSRGTWLQQHFVKAPRLTGTFEEIESIETMVNRAKGEPGPVYVLVNHGDEEVWFNAGTVQSAGSYTIKYQYATQTRKHQYGIWGRAEVRYDERSLAFQLMAVRSKIRSKDKSGEAPKTGPKRIGTHSSPYTLVGPGLYRGRVQARGKYIKDSSKHGLWGSISIYVAQQWVDGKWKAGVQKASDVTTNVFVHPAVIPDWLDGCLALGTNHSDHGFDGDSSKDAMREVLGLMGIKTRAEYDAVQALPASKCPLVFLTVTDERPGAKPPLKLTVRIPVTADKVAISEDVLTLRSSDGTYEKSLKVKDEAKEAAGKWSVTFEGIDRRKRYSLDMKHGTNAPYCVLLNRNYAQLAGAETP